MGELGEINHALVGWSFRYRFARRDSIGLQLLHIPLSEGPILKKIAHGTRSTQVCQARALFFCLASLLTRRFRCFKQSDSPAFLESPMGPWQDKQFGQIH
jgi:hypothetical protein